MADQKDYKYYAFISYSRKNSKAAAYFHRQLEHFRIPVKYVAEENRPPKQKFLRPIFRDRRDLEANENSFTEDIKKALAQSRYLIVLCSPESAQSNWVDEEIRYFLETHNNDYKLIVPVILAGEPGEEGELECLPTSLRLKEIVERNLSSMIPDEGEDEKAGWLTGVVQSMSYMLKVSREKIRATVDAEKVRQAKIYSFIGIICTVIFAGLAFWAIKAERIAESNRINAENNWRIAEQNRIVAESNQRKAEINERRALAGEKDAMEKKELSDKTLEFVQKMLQDGKPDEHGPKKVIDLLTEQVSKIELLEPEELRYSVSFLVGQIMFEQGLLKPAERLLVTSFNYFKQDGNDLGAVGAANILGILYATSSRIEEAEKMYKYIEDKNNIKSNGIFDQSLLLFNMACVYRQTKNIEKAEELCLKALRLENKGNGILRVKMSCFLANIAFAKGEYKRAEEYYSIAEKETQDYGLETSLEMLELKAGLCKVNGEYDKARSIYESAIEKEKIRDRGKSFISGILMNDLGILEMDVGNHEKALKCFEEAVLIGEYYAKDGSLNLAMIYNNIGNVLCSLKSYVRAQEYYDKALVMAKKFGEESSQVITILRNLGHIEYEKGGGREKLRNLLLQIKDMSVKVYGSSNAEEGYAQYMLSKISMEKGDHTQALTQIEEALRIYDLLKRDDEGLYAHMLNDYALIQDKLGMDSNAVASINKAYKIAQSKLSVKDRANIMRNHELILGMEKTNLTKDRNNSSHDIEKLKVEAKRCLDEGRYDDANQVYTKIGEILIERGDGLSSEFSRVCNQRGIVMYRQGKYTEALPFFVKARDMDMFIKGSNSVDVAVLHKNIADALFNIGEMRGAKKAYKAALAVRLKQKEKDNKELSQLYTDMAKVNQNLEDYKSAEEYFNRAHKIDRVEYGEMSIQVAEGLECLGELFEQKKQYHIAVTNYLSALRMYQDLPTVSSNKISYIFNQIGFNYSGCGDLKKSMEYHYKAYGLNVKIYGITNRESVVSLENVAHCERKCGNYAKAIEMYKESLELKKTIKSFTEKDIALTYNSIGLCYSELRDHESAKDAHYESLKRNLKLYGREHREVMIDYWNLALEYKAMKKYGEENEFMRKSLDVALVLYDESSKEVCERYEAMAECFSRLGKYENEVKLREKVLRFKSVPGTEDNNKLAEAYFSYAIDLHNSSDYNKARENYHKAVDIYKKSGTNLYEHLALILYGKGTTEMCMGLYDEAFKTFDESLKIIKGNDVNIQSDSPLHELPHRLKECEEWQKSHAVIQISKVLPGGIAERLGIQTNDLWLSIGSWKVQDGIEKRHDLLLSFASKEWNSLTCTNRIFSVARKMADGWKKIIYEVPKGAGDFHYRISPMKKEEFKEMIEQISIKTNVK